MRVTGRNRRGCISIRVTLEHEGPSCRETRSTWTTAPAKTPARQRKVHFAAYLCFLLSSEECLTELPRSRSTAPVTAEHQDQVSAETHCLLQTVMRINMLS